MDFLYRPIGIWPGPMTKVRKRASFKARYDHTLKLLDYELFKLGARNVVLQVDLPESKIRRDGKPYADATPGHPGVILSFESRYGHLSYPCDRYDRLEDNVRAVALSLEALRAVDRYGVTRRAEQYKGWQALPDRTVPAAMSRAEAFTFFLNHTSSPPRQNPWTEEDMRRVYRELAVKFHPDRGGDEVLFKRLQQAKEALGL